MNIDIFITNDIFSGLLILIIVLFLILISELLFNFLKIKGYYTRKFIHIVTGLILILSPYIFSNNFIPIIIALLFSIINFISIKLNQFKSIHNSKAENYGTFYFPIAYLILCIFWWEKTFTFQLSLALLAFNDPFASIIGNTFPNSKKFIIWNDIKTINGTIAMALSSFLLIYIWFYFDKNFNQEITELLFISLYVSLISTISEIISYKGSDNISIPLFSAISIDLANNIILNNYILETLYWIIFLASLCYLFFKVNLLKQNGSIAAFFIGIILFNIGKWKFLIPISIFFLSSSILSKLASIFTNQKKIEPNRDLNQVFSNGIISLFLAIIWFYTSNNLFYYSFLATISAVNSDTWATEIGSFSKNNPRNSINFKEIKKGESGGITPLGILGGILGSIIIPIFSIVHFNLMILVSICGFIGNYFDSILGSTLQEKYVCIECGFKNEKGFHCNKPSKLLNGLKFFSNNIVNLLCSAIGGITLIILFLAL